MRILGIPEMFFRQTFLNIVSKISLYSVSTQRKPSLCVMNILRYSTKYICLDSNQIIYTQESCLFLYHIYSRLHWQTDQDYIILHHNGIGMVFGFHVFFSTTAFALLLVLFKLRGYQWKNCFQWQPVRCLYS